MDCCSRERVLCPGKEARAFDLVMLLAVCFHSIGSGAANDAPPKICPTRMMRLREGAAPFAMRLRGGFKCMWEQCRNLSRGEAGIKPNVAAR